MKPGLVAGLVVAQAVTALAVHADAESCADAYEKAQTLQRQSKLIDARRQLVDCAQDSCPAVLRQDCVPWLAKLDETLPRVSVKVQGMDGCDRAGTQISVDGVVAAKAGNGLPIDVDPGPHEILASVDGQTVSQKIVVVLGERQRLVALSFAPAGVSCGALAVTPAPAPPLGSDERPPPRLAYVLGAVGLGFLAVGAGFGISAWNQKSTLDDCKGSGSCAAQDVDSMRHTFLAADLIGGAGLATLAAAALVYVFAR